MEDEDENQNQQKEIQSQNKDVEQDSFNLSFSEINKLEENQQQQQIQNEETPESQINNYQQQDNQFQVFKNESDFKIINIDPTLKKTKGFLQKQGEHIQRNKNKKKTLEEKKRLSVQTKQALFQQNQSDFTSSFMGQTKIKSENRKIFYLSLFTPKYMKARVKYPSDFLSINDVLPSKLQQLDIDRKNKIEIIKQNKKFRISYQTSLILPNPIQKKRISDNDHENHKNTDAQEIIQKRAESYGVYNVKNKNYDIAKQYTIPIIQSDRTRLIMFLLSTQKTMKRLTVNNNFNNNNDDNFLNQNGGTNRKNKVNLNVLQMEENFSQEPKIYNIMKDDQTALTKEKKMKKKEDENVKVHFVNPEWVYNTYFSCPTTENNKNESHQKLITLKNLEKNISNLQQSAEHNSDQYQLMLDNLRKQIQSQNGNKKEGEKNEDEDKKDKYLHIFDDEQFMYEEKYKQILDGELELDVNEDGYSYIEEQWNGENVIESIRKWFDQDYYVIKRIKNIIQSLNFTQDDVEIWEGGFIGVIYSIRRVIKRFVLSSFFEGFIMLCVFLNTIVLSLDGLVSEEGDKNLQLFNFLFTLIFALDMTLKIIGIGLKEYLQDPMNVFDSFIVILSIAELIIFGYDGGSAISAFRSVRIFRTFRVLRVTRLIRSLQYMRVIMKVVGNTLTSFIYIFILLILFNYIYCLLGMSLFGAKFTYEDKIRQNFDTFLNSFLSVFQIMTLENWNDILVATLRTDVNKFLILTYFISWIFIGNYVLLNLFLAILLEGFDSNDIDEEVNSLEQGFEIGQNIDIEDENKSSNMAQLLAYQQNDSDEDEQEEENNGRFFQGGQTFQSLKMNSIRQEFVYFKDVTCQKVFYVISQENKFRKLCYYIVKHRFFEPLILTAIVLSSIKLIVDTYVDKNDPEQEDLYETMTAIDLVFTIFFTCEALVKTVALGFVVDQNSYLRDSWSQLDFFIVVAGFIDLIFQSGNFEVVKIFRLLRTLRPLRFISHNIQMKLVVTALLESVSGIINVLIVVILIWMMFGILGVNLMKGKMNYCSFPPSDTEEYDIYKVREEECNTIPGAEWKRYDTNMDNILEAMLTLFVLSTLEGWPNYLFLFIDANKEGPVKDSQPLILLYFIVFIFVGSMFLLNLFIGVIFLNYRLAENAAKNKYLTDSQARWIQLQKLIVKSKPDYSSIKAPDSLIRRSVWRFCESVYLETFIMICILLNIVTMAMTYETSTEEYNSALKLVNLIFTCVFIAEAILKLYAYGVKRYFDNSWNQFDFFVVLTSILDIILDFSGNQVITFLKVGPQLSRVIRVLRVTRLLKLIKSLEGLRKLIQVIIYSLPSLMNVVSLLFLIFLIFSILANFLFGEYTEGDLIDEYVNFGNFSSSFILLFTAATGEDWHVLMFDCIHNAGNKGPVLFFIFFIVITQFIMLNLFIMVILQQFEDNFFSEDNALQNFETHENNFKTTWTRYTKENEGIFIKDKQLVNFYLDLKTPLGLGLEEELEKKEKQLKDANNLNRNEDTEEQKNFYVQQGLLAVRAQFKEKAAKQIMHMNIYTDFMGKIYFNEFFFYLMKYFVQDVYINNPKSGKTQDEFNEAKSIMKKQEALTLGKLKRIKNQVCSESQKTKKTNDQNTKKRERVNPLVLRLFTQMCFKTWLKYTESYQQSISKGHKQELSFSSTDTDEGSYEDDIDYENMDQDEIETMRSQAKKQSIIKRTHNYQNATVNASSQQYFLPDANSAYKSDSNIDFQDNIPVFKEQEEDQNIQSQDSYRIQEDQDEDLDSQSNSDSNIESNDNQNFKQDIKQPNIEEDTRRSEVDTNRALAVISDKDLQQQENLITKNFDTNAGLITLNDFEQEDLEGNDFVKQNNKIKKIIIKNTQNDSNSNSHRNSQNNIINYNIHTNIIVNNNFYVVENNNNNSNNNNNINQDQIQNQQTNVQTIQIRSHSEKQSNDNNSSLTKSINNSIIQNNDDNSINSQGNNKLNDSKNQNNDSQHSNQENQNHDNKNDQQNNNNN